MRRVVQSLSVFLVETIGLEGTLFFGGMMGLTGVGWSLDWRVGVAVASIAAVVLAVAVAYASQKPKT